MDSAPPEILHKIFRHLKFDEVAALRAAAPKYATIGVEYLATRIRFHCSQASLNRLQEFTKHPVIRHQITNLVYEANLIADVGCFHNYRAHFELQHHINDKPQEPKEGCTTRERRLYLRNLAKWEAKISVDFEKYEEALSDQRQLLNSKFYNQLLKSCAKSFPKLESIEVSTVRRCKHHLSQRFLEKFPLSCEVPMFGDSARSVESLSLLALNPSKPRPNLKTLQASLLDVDFFSPERQLKIKQTFSTLRDLGLDLEVDSFMMQMAVGPQRFGLQGGLLTEALITAADLEELRINFKGIQAREDNPNLKDILGQGTWPKLKSLDIDFFTTEAEYFLDTLKRQNSLKALYVGMASLSTSDWVATITKMRTELKLDNFCATGVLDDADEVYLTDYIDADYYIETHDKIRLTDALDCYVTNHDDEEEDLLNPLVGGEWGDEDDLEEVLGSLADEDSCMSDVSHMDCD